MITQIEILVVGCNKPIMETIARLINKEGKWLATTAFTVQEASEYGKVKISNWP